MELNHKLHTKFKDMATKVRITHLSLGLGYTAVTTDQGGVGLAYTYFDRKTGCTLIRHYRDFEDQAAIQLLDLILGCDPLERSMALALVNALNHRRALGFSEDPRNEMLLKVMGIEAGTKVAMVGHFGPLIGLLEGMGASVCVLDLFRGEGAPGEFYAKLGGWADTLLLTATALLNNTAEDILSRTAPDVKAVILGPSTPMVPEAFGHLPVKMLAGTVPIDTRSVLKAVRHGVGARTIGGAGRKVFCLLP